MMAPTCLVQDRLWLTALCILCISVSSGRAQTTTTGPALTMQRSLDQSGANVIRDPLGRPCLDVEAAARAGAANPAMQDHIVSIKNNCAKLIKAKVCYANSDHCNEVVLQAYKRVDTILGSMKGVTTFRYTITQR
ncbi:hypothetical protein CVM73_08705 [Bradyrhizobium forestalis]|uniref:UrcA family protein n=1 Tax=Bradyrhizobium forestalis TaxID=1419263 RepID=A0A2M8RCS8_9BRAD|nr:hypothetical protein [Bradyrhizobium forestalis]PJG55626.1 hypothetical protein CVM73_08705 [Bradyrhizobium forestalis]